MPVWMPLFVNGMDARTIPPPLYADRGPALMFDSARGTAMNGMRRLYTPAVADVGVATTAPRNVLTPPHAEPRAPRLLEANNVDPSWPTVSAAVAATVALPPAGTVTDAGLTVTMLAPVRLYVIAVALVLWSVIVSDSL